MQHVAIMKGKLLIKAILEGKKTIESRWYINKISPWNRIKIGEEIYFKEFGGAVTAKAKVTKVVQYENLDKSLVEKTLVKYGQDIVPGMSENEKKKWQEELVYKRYCILMFLTKVKKLKPFYIDKRGFGFSCAWLVVKNIRNLQ